MRHYSGPPVPNLTVVAMRSNGSYWLDVAHLPSFLNFYSAYGGGNSLMNSNTYLLNGGRAAWEFKQYLLREARVLLFGREVDSDLLEDAIANGDFLTYWSYFDDNTDSDYAEIAVAYHDGVFDFRSSLVFAWASAYGMTGAKESEISQSLMRQHYNHIKKYGDLPNEDEITAMHNKAFKEAGLSTNAWAGNVPIGRHLFDHYVDEGTEWTTPLADTPSEFA